MRTRSGSAMMTENDSEHSDELQSLISKQKGDTKLILSIMMGQFNKLNGLLEEKNKQIDTLRTEVKTLHDKVSRLEDQIDSEDAYERRDTVILAGKQLPEGHNQEDIYKIVETVCQQKLGFKISRPDINTAHRLGRRNMEGPDKRPIILKLCSRDTKRDLMIKCRTVQKDVAVKNRLYINESLTPKRGKIAQVLRQMQRVQGSAVTGSTSRDGNVYAFTKSSIVGGRDLKHLVNTHRQLVKFCEDYVNSPLNRFLDEWKY